MSLIYASEACFECGIYACDLGQRLFLFIRTMWALRLPPRNGKHFNIKQQIRHKYILVFKHKIQYMVVWNFEGRQE